MKDFYIPYEARTSDSQWSSLVTLIMNHGREMQSRLVDKKTQRATGAKRILGHMMRFSMSNGFPMITERDLLSEGEKSGSQFNMALAEIIAFINGAHSQDELKNFGVGWWAPWVTEEKCRKRGLPTGDLGPGSYGVTLATFPHVVSSRTIVGSDATDIHVAHRVSGFDQIDAVVTQIKENPELRTHLWTTWNPVYQFRTSKHEQKVVVSPCHGTICHFVVDAQLGTISLHHFQRSADTLVGLVFNMIQYAAVLLMVAQVTGYVPDELVYTISDAHIYDDERQWEPARKMLATKPARFPTVTLDPDVKDIRDFRPHHFRVADYEPRLPRMQIWTPI